MIFIEYPINKSTLLRFSNDWIILCDRNFRHICCEYPRESGKEAYQFWSTDRASIPHLRRPMIITIHVVLAFSLFADPAICPGLESCGTKTGDGQEIRRNLDPIGLLTPIRKYPTGY